MIDPSELGAWQRLLETPGVGRDSARKLLAAFGSPQAVIGAAVDARHEVVGPLPAQALSDVPEALPALVAATLAWLQADAAEPRAVVTLGDPRYPSALLNAADPPVLLYAQGRLDLLQADSIAIVELRTSHSATCQSPGSGEQFSGRVESPRSDTTRRSA